MTDLPPKTQVSSDDQTKQQDLTGSVSGLSAGKERGELRRGKQEVTPITEYTKKVDLEPEVEGWLEKMEKEDSSLQQPVLDDAPGQPVLDDSVKQDNGFKVVLPLTKDEVEKGLQHKVFDSIRWLAEWCTKMIKMFHNKVAYRKQ